MRTFVLGGDGDRNRRCIRSRENSAATFASSARVLPAFRSLMTLSRPGQKVIVLDDGAIGRGMTARTTAHLVNALDDRYYDLEKCHGEEARGWRRKATARRSIGSRGSWRTKDRLRFRAGRRLSLRAA